MSTTTGAPSFGRAGFRLMSPRIIIYTYVRNVYAVNYIASYFYNTYIIYARGDIIFNRITRSIECTKFPFWHVRASVIITKGFPESEKTERSVEERARAED